MDCQISLATLPEKLIFILAVLYAIPYSVIGVVADVKIRMAWEACAVRFGVLQLETAG